MNKTLLLLYTLGILVLVSCQSGDTVRKSGFSVEGVDVSHHQDDIKWDLVQQDKIDFAFLKATEGSNFVDPHFRENWQSTKENGIVRGAYHFFRPTKSAEQQFRNFSKEVSLSLGDLPPVLDVEVLDGQSRATLISSMRTWLYLAEIKYGVKPIIYTNLKFYYRYLAGQFDDYPFWLARYSSKNPTVGPALKLAFWQYGDRGRVEGIDTYVDLNVFYGEKSSFDTLRIQTPEVFTLR